MKIRFAGRHLIRHWIALVLLVLVGSTLLQGQDVMDDPIGPGDGGESAASADAGSLDDLGENGTDGATEGEALTAEEESAQIRALLEQAAELMRQKQWAEAAAVFDGILKRSSYVARGAAPLAYLGLGECFYELKNYEQAVASFSRAQSGQADPATVSRSSFLRGKSYIELMRYREAIEDMGTVLVERPDDPEAHFNSGKAILRLVVTSSPGGIDQGGQSQLLQGAQSLQRAIELKPEYGDAYLERGRIMIRVGETDTAIEDFQKAVEFLGGESDASAELGKSLFRRAGEKSSALDLNVDELKSDLQTCIASLDRYLKGAELGQKSKPWENRDPVDVEPEDIWLIRAEAKIGLGDELTGPERTALYRDALADCDKLLTYKLTGISESRAYLNRGLALRMLNDLRPAVEAITRAIERFPSQYGAYNEAYLRRGICLYHLGEERAALQDFEAAASLSNNPYDYEPRAMYWAGMTMVKLGDLDAAIRNYSRAINAAPNYTPPYLNRGLAYLHVGRYDRALSDFNTLMRLNPKHPTVQRYRELAQANLR